MIARQPGRQFDEIASILRVSPEALYRLLEDRERAVDIDALIDVVAALARSFAVDPQWLRTGQYDSTSHSQALQLSEARTDESFHALRDFVREQLQRLRERLRFGTPPRSPERDF